MLKKQRDFLRLRHAKAHDDGTLKNPLFLKMKTPRWRIAAACLAGMLAIAGAGIGITHIPALQLQAVTIQGTIALHAQDIESVAREYIARKSLPFCSPTNAYFTNLHGIEAELMARFPLQAVSVTRQGQSLHVSVTEQVTTIALRTKEKTVMLDVAGAHVRDATSEESRAIDIRIGSAAAAPDEVIIMLQPDMPVVLNTKNESVTALAPLTASALISLAEQLPINGMHATAFYLEGLSAPFVRVDTTEEYDLYVDIGLRTIEEQMHALNAVISADDFVPPEQYIDLRFGAYVYKK
jgi:hypothetical protein